MKMIFLDAVVRVKQYLRVHGSVSLGALKHEFDFVDEEQLSSLINELVNVQGLATLEEEILHLVGDRTQGTETSAAGDRPDGVSLTDAVQQFEIRILRETLERCHWNQTRAAQGLGITRRILKCFPS
jgi:DNA-binding NtrC family response regulator